MFTDHASYEDIAIRLTGLGQLMQYLSDPWLRALVQAASASLEAMDASPEAKEIRSAVERVVGGSGRLPW